MPLIRALGRLSDLQVVKELVGLGRNLEEALSDIGLGT